MILCNIGLRNTNITEYQSVLIRLTCLYNIFSIKFYQIFGVGGANDLTSDKVDRVFTHVFMRLTRPGEAIKEKTLKFWILSVTLMTPTLPLPKFGHLSTKFFI